MKVLILAIGKPENKPLELLVNDYLKRLQHYVPVELKALPYLKKTSKMSQIEINKKEGEALLKNFEVGDFVALLDENGQALKSVAFAKFMQNKMNAGINRVVFVIGGAFGFSEEVYKRADFQLSLSKMTFPHQLVKLIFTEQLYRAMTIIRGEPYHHE